MEIEHDIKVMPITENMQEEMAKLDRLGWKLIPGVTPVAIYHLIREKNKTDSTAAFGTMTIDEAGVFIIPPDQKTQ